MRTRWFGWIGAIVLALGLALGAAPALAQSSGGSFGGGSFSGGGGSFGGGGGFSGGGSYGGGGSFSGPGRGPGGSSSPIGIVITVLFLALAFGIRTQQWGGRSRGGHTDHGARGWSQVDVSAIRLGIDWRARAEIQRRLRELAERTNTGSKSGLSAALKETITLLRENKLAWLYAGVSNHHPMSAASAEGIFRQHGVQARAAFRDELVRNVDGAKTTEDKEYRAHKTEGEGVVVVTLVVAATREIVDIDRIDRAEQIEILLEDLRVSAAPYSLTAMEVIWSPAAENDRMSTAELEQFYPSLKKIDESSIGGRVFCDYCTGPYAEELGQCPHCGAPRG